MDYEKTMRGIISHAWTACSEKFSKVFTPVENTSRRFVEMYLLKTGSF